MAPFCRTAARQAAPASACSADAAGVSALRHSGARNNSPIAGPTASQGSTCASGQVAASAANSVMVATESAEADRVDEGEHAADHRARRVGGGERAELRRVARRPWRPTAAATAPHSGSGASSSHGASRPHSPLQASCDAGHARAADAPHQRAADHAAEQADRDGGEHPPRRGRAVRSAARRWPGCSTKKAYSSHMWPK